MKLKNGNIDICIWSEDYQKLAKWYEEVLGITPTEHLILPDDTGFNYEMDGNNFYIGKHSEISGKSKDPYRIMISFNVESVTQAYEEIKDKDEIIAKPFPAPPGGFWCMTFKDPDGNILQLAGDE